MSELAHENVRTPVKYDNLKCNRIREDMPTENKLLFRGVMKALKMLLPMI